MSQKRLPDEGKERSEEVFPEEKRQRPPALRRSVISSVFYLLF